jgi:transposase
MVCHFLPKFHPEMNPIEYFWAWIKRYYRERSNGQWQKAKNLVDEALLACPLPTIRRFFRRANHYASVYRHGATGPVAEFAVKQYRSHRGVQKQEMEVAQAQWEKKMKLGVI